MCKEIKILGRGDKARVDLLLHGHVMAHVTLDTKAAPSQTPCRSINRLADNQKGSIKVFVDSKKVDFAYELVAGYVLDSIGVEEYECKIHLFEDTDDLCVLQNLVFAIREGLSPCLQVSSDGGAVSVSLDGRVVYEATMAL